jgi:hypothetical protein
MEPGEPKFDRENGISKIVGFTPEETVDLNLAAQEIFENQDGKQIFYRERDQETAVDVKGLEREKTPEEKEVILAILRKLPEFVRKYGGKPVNITEGHIHVLDPNKLGEGAQKDREERGISAAHYSSQQFISIFDNKNILELAFRVVHEAIHFDSFQSQEKKPGKKYGTQRRRSGFAVDSYVTGEMETYFHGINEALTEELTKRFADKYFNDIPALKLELEKTRKLKDLVRQKYPDRSGLADDIAFVSKESDVLEESRAGYYSYSTERKKTNTYFRTIYEQNSGEYKSQEDVFEVFARAMMTGNLMPAARLVEETFGPGSFRKLGIISAKP